MDERDEKRRAGGETGHDHAAAGGAAGGEAFADADFRALAEDWIAIWQSEITAYLTDPETQAQWSAMLALWGEAAQAMMAAMPAAARGFGPMAAAKPARNPRPGHERERSSRAAAQDQSAGADAAPGAAPPTAASRSRDDEVRRLEQRVAELERRLGERDGTDAGRADAGPAADVTRIDGRRSRGPAGPDRRPHRGGRARG